MITRRRGIGTIINKHVLNVTSRLDLEKEFLEEITDAGYVPSVGFIDIKIELATEAAVNHLKVNFGEELFVIEKLILADGKPAIYCLDYLAKRLVIDHDFDSEELRKPIFEFLERRCKVSVETDLTQLVPIIADNHLAEIFNISIGTPLIHLDEVGYDLKGNAVLWSKEYYCPGIINFTILRRKI